VHDVLTYRELQCLSNQVEYMMSSLSKFYGRIIYIFIITRACLDTLVNLLFVSILNFILRKTLYWLPHVNNYHTPYNKIILPRANCL
jgi:hypothetical protein